MIVQFKRRILLINSFPLFYFHTATENNMITRTTNCCTMTIYIWKILYVYKYCKVTFPVSGNLSGFSLTNILIHCLLLKYQIFLQIRSNWNAIESLFEYHFSLKKKFLYKFRRKITADHFAWNCYRNLPRISIKCVVWF